MHYQTNKWLLLELPTQELRPSFSCTLNTELRYGLGKILCDYLGIFPKWRPQPPFGNLLFKNKILVDLKNC